AEERDRRQRRRSSHAARLYLSSLRDLDRRIALRGIRAGVMAVVRDAEHELEQEIAAVGDAQLDDQIPGVEQRAHATRSAAARPGFIARRSRVRISGTRSTARARARTPPCR